MSGTTLVRTTLAGVRPLGVRGEPLHHAQAQLRAVVRRRLGDRHFHLLAEPQPHQLGGRIDWYSELEDGVRPLAALPEAERDTVRADIDALLADIDRLGQSLEDGPTEDGKLAGKSLRLASKRPSDDYLFLVGEQPVVVCWGYDTEAAGAVLPEAFVPPATGAAPSPTAGALAQEPFVPMATGAAGAAVLQRERVPWLFWLLAGLLAILIALLAAYLLRHYLPVPPALSVAELPPEPPPPAPPAPPDPTIGLQGDLDSARDQEGKLKVTLASLRDELRNRILQCKPPEPVKPPEPPRPPVAERKPDPPPPPKPKVAERKPEPPPPPPRPPDDRMRMPKAPTNDYAFLKGCWRTDTFKHGPRIPPGYATYCFDASGRGSMEFRFSDGTICRAPATARFSGSVLRVVDADSTCSPRGTWAQDRLDCTAGADGVAYCHGENRTERWTVNLHRTGS